MLLKVVTQAGQTTEREVARKKVATDAKTGDGVVTFKADDDEGGQFIIARDAATGPTFTEPGRGGSRADDLRQEG